MQKRRQKHCKSQRWWLTQKKQDLKDTMGLLHTWTHRDCDSTHSTCTRFVPTKSQHRKAKWAQGPTPNQKLFVTSTCWERKNQFAPMEWPWVCQPHARAVFIPRSSWSAQRRLHVFVCLFFLNTYIMLLSFRFPWWGQSSHVTVMLFSKELNQTDVWQWAYITTRWDCLFIISTIERGICYTRSKWKLSS